MIIAKIKSYPNGDLQVSCGDMVPSHGSNSPNSSTSPYNLYVENLVLNNTSFVVNERLVGKNCYFR